MVRRVLGGLQVVATRHAGDHRRTTCGLLCALGTVRARASRHAAPAHITHFSLFVCVHPPLYEHTVGCTRALTCDDCCGTWWTGSATVVNIIKIKNKSHPRRRRRIRGHHRGMTAGRMRCDTAHDLLLPLKLTYVTTAAWLRHSKYTRARTQSGPGDCVRVPAQGFLRRGRTVEYTPLGPVRALRTLHGAALASSLPSL